MCRWRSWESLFQTCSQFLFIFSFLLCYTNALHSDCPSPNRTWDMKVHSFILIFKQTCSISQNNKHAIKAKMQQLTTEVRVVFGLRLELHKTLQMPKKWAKGEKLFKNNKSPKYIQLVNYCLIMAPSWEPPLFFFKLILMLKLNNKKWNYNDLHHCTVIGKTLTFKWFKWSKSD